MDDVQGRFEGPRTRYHHYAKTKTIALPGGGNYLQIDARTIFRLTTAMLHEDDTFETRVPSST